MLRHGYTLESLSRLSHFAAQRKFWVYGLEFTERHEVAWSAMAEHLYASDDPPTVGELIDTAWHAISSHAYSRSQFLGRNNDAPHTGTRPRFEAYWQHISRPTPSLDDAVIDRLALAQIWPRLRPAHREALAALAATTTTAGQPRPSTSPTPTSNH